MLQARESLGRFRLCCVIENIVCHRKEPLFFAGCCKLTPQTPSFQIVKSIGLNMLLNRFQNRSVIYLMTDLMKLRLAQLVYIGNAEASQCWSTCADAEMSVRSARAMSNWSLLRDATLRSLLQREQ